MAFGNRFHPGLRRIYMDENAERVVQDVDHRNQVRERVGGSTGSGTSLELHHRMVALIPTTMPTRIERLVENDVRTDPQTML